MDRTKYGALVSEGNGYYRAGPESAPLVVYRRYSGSWRILWPKPTRGALDLNSLRACRVAVELWVAGSKVRAYSGELV